MVHPFAVQVILDRYDNLVPDDVVRRLRYSSFVSVPKRYMYFEVPKAACTQMKEILRTVEGAPPVKLFAGGIRATRREMFVHARENVPLPSLVDLDDKTQREVLESPDFLRMTFVRNPYTRLVSTLKNKVMLCEPGQEDVYLDIRGHLPEFHAKSLITIDEFVAYLAAKCDLRICDAHWRRQVDHAFFAAFNYSLVGRVERMDEGLRRFQQHLDLSEALVAHRRNVSGSFGVATYTRSLADTVYQLYQPDFEVLGYDRGAWPASDEGSVRTSRSATVPVEKFIDEIIERNLVIAHLYRERNRLSEERDQLRDEMRKVSRLHLLALANALLAFRRASIKFLSRVKARMRRMFYWQSVDTGGETYTSKGR